MLKDRVPDEESIAVVKQLLFAEYGVSERDQEKMLRESTRATRQAELDERLQDLRQGLAATEATGRQEEVADLQRAILKTRQDALAEERTAYMSAATPCRLNSIWRASHADNYSSCGQRISAGRANRRCGVCATSSALTRG